MRALAPALLAGCLFLISFVSESLTLNLVKIPDRLRYCSEEKAYIAIDSALGKFNFFFQYFWGYRWAAWIVWHVQNSGKSACNCRLSS